MANVDIAYGGQSYNVDINGLEDMAPAQQSAAYAQALAAVKARAASDAAPQSQQQNAPAASQAPAAAPADNPNDSFPNDFQSGMAGGEHQLRATARLADQLPDWVPGKSAVSGFGHGQQAIQQPQGYTPAPSRLTDAIRNRDWSAIPGLLAHAGVQSVPGMIPGIAAGAVGGPLAAAGVITAQNAGENVEARQAANGNAQPSAGDLIGGGLTSLAQGAIGAGGLSAASRGLVRGVAGEAAAGAANDAVGQVGTSVGTDQGTHLDPAEVAAAGLQQGAARGVTLAPGLARAGVKAGVDGLMASQLDKPVSNEHAASITRVEQDYQQAAKNAATTKGDASPLAVLNSLKGEYATRAVETVRQLRDVGIIDAENARTAQAAFEQARRHNNSITESGGEGPATLFDQIKQLPIGDEAASTLHDLARDMDTASTQSFAKNQTGPLQMLGSTVGRLGALGGAVASGDPHAMIGAVLGSPITAKVGGAVGKGLDNVFGTATPTLLLKAKLARRMLDKAGVDAGPSSLDRVDTLRSAIDDATPDLRAAQADRARADEPSLNDMLDAQDTPRAAAQKDREVAAGLKQGRGQDAQDQANIDKSMQLQGRLQALEEKQKQADLAKPIPSADGTAPVGPQTATEIRSWEQILRNRAVLAKVQAGQRQLLQRADDASLDNRAQRAIDARTRSNAQALLEARKVPSDHPEVDDTAKAAAAASALQRARSVIGRSNSEPGLRDRIAVGDTGDVIPPDARIAPNGVPIVRGPAGPSGGPLQAAPEAPAPTAPAPPQAAPAAPVAAPEAPAHPDPTSAAITALEALPGKEMASKVKTLKRYTERREQYLEGQPEDRQALIRSLNLGDEVTYTGPDGQPATGRLTGRLDNGKVQVTGAHTMETVSLDALQGRVAAQPQPAPSVRPQATPAAPVAAPEAPSVPGWVRYVAHDSGATPEEVHQAVDDMRALGIIPEDRAAELRSRRGGINAEEARPIQAYMAEQMGKRFGNGARGAAPDGYRGPIHDPEKWQQAKGDYQAHAASKLDLARGNPDLEAAIVNIRDEPTAVGKQQLASDYLKPLVKQAAQRGNTAAVAKLALAQQLLNGPLLKSKVP